MKFKENDRVRHLNAIEWGIGKVLEDSSKDFVKVFFIEAGDKTLFLQQAKLEKLSEEEGNHPVLNNLTTKGLSKKVKYQSLTQSKAQFLQLFPDGFLDDKYVKQERDYKIKAHRKAIDILGKDELNAMLHKNEFGEICDRAKKIANATNLIYPNEKMALKDGLKTETGEKLFSESLYILLYGNEELELRFTQFAKVLEEINADKWTTASYFPFIVYPEKYMFVKPKVTQSAAEINAFEINYNSKLNWLTYKSVLQFSEYLKEALKDLKPKDMIDIQSFVWRIAQN